MKKINDELMQTISGYMNDDIREDLHFKLAPCTNELFLIEYCKQDEEMEGLLLNEFGIDITDVFEDVTELVKDEILDKEMSFSLLDNTLMAHGYYSVFDDGVTEDIKRDKNVVYTSKTTNEAELQIFFDITINNGQDEAEENFELKVLEVAAL